jgi:hypothetical protein
VFAQRTQRMQSSASRKLLKLTEHPEMISFAGGLPVSGLFPVEKPTIDSNIGKQACSCHCAEVH